MTTTGLSSITEPPDRGSAEPSTMGLCNSSPVDRSPTCTHLTRALESWPRHCRPPHPPAEATRAITAFLPAATRASARLHRSALIEDGLPSDGRARSGPRSSEHAVVGDDSAR